MDVGHIDRDHPRGGSDTRKVVAAFTQDHDHFPGARRNLYPAIRKRSHNSTPAAHDVDLVAALYQAAAITFEPFPRTLIVVGGLRQNVGHEKGGVVIRPGRRAVAGRCHMPAIIATTGVVARLHAVPIRRQAVIRLEVAARRAANIGCAEVPGCPVGDAGVAIIRQRILAPRDQVIVWCGWISDRIRRIAKVEVSYR